MTTIYADNAATTQMSRAAIDAMLPYLETIYGNPSSLHSVGQQAAGALLSARDRIAKCLNASPREIYFTSGGSEADNQAILSAARLGERKGKKHIISTAFEHHAVLHTLKKLEKEGFTVELLPVGPIGTVTAQQRLQGRIVAGGDPVHQGYIVHCPTTLRVSLPYYTRKRRKTHGLFSPQRENPVCRGIRGCCRNVLANVFRKRC